MEIQISDEEYGLMTEILQERHSALLHEIAHTDHHDFKQMLKKRLEVLEWMMEKLGVAQPTR